MKIARHFSAGVAAQVIPKVPEGRLIELPSVSRPHGTRNNEVANIPALKCRAIFVLSLRDEKLCSIGRPARLAGLIRRAGRKRMTVEIAQFGVYRLLETRNACIS